jgi:hypothetical protein
MGSMFFGGYVDGYKASFLSSFDPENLMQLGLVFNENMSLDIAFISTDKNLNKGDLRAYFKLKNLAGVPKFDVGVGYRSNVFDEVYDKTGNVVNTLDLALRVPIISEVGVLKSLNFFLEAGILNLNEEDANGKATDLEIPVLGGLELALYRGIDKIVVEAEWDKEREGGKPYLDEPGKKPHYKEVAWSIYLQKDLTDRFGLQLGAHSARADESGKAKVFTKDFGFSARLTGRIN